MSVEFQNVSFAYQPGLPVLQEVSFRVSAGEFLLIVGQNGAGKSTILKLLNGILKPTSGRVVVAGLDTTAIPTATLAAQVCVTFQNPADQLFASTVRAEIEFAPRNLRRPDRDALVEDALTLCELGTFVHSHPYDLAPAQRKLLAAASAIASGSPFLAFDEPSSGLSQIERRILQTMIDRLRERRKGFLVVSHDLELFLRFATKVVVLHQGKILYDGGPSDLISQERTLRSAGLRLPMAMRLEKILNS